jgi:hypothetical protein
MRLLDDPEFVRLVFGVHREPGAYALLLGSGVSRGAGIPSGWDITVKLVEELASIQMPGIEDTLQWYANKYREEPRYDKVLALLGKGSADRQAIIRGFFEPTEDERKKGIKAPGVAHRSIVRLVKQGYIHVILTTNFDRLLENALSEVGVTPNVVNGAEGIDGVRSYASEQCTIVKINGDYQDTRIRNSIPELSEYPCNLATYIGAILDAYGLVICGWSAKYDTALASLLVEHPNIRYGTYWLSNEKPGSEAEQIANSRKADVIQIASADAAFQALADAIQSQDAGTSSDPFSVDQITTIVRGSISDPARETQLADVLQEESRRVTEIIPGLVSEVATLTREAVQAVIERTAAAVEPLASGTACASYYGSVEQVRWTQNAFGRVAQRGLDGLEKDPTYGLILLPAALVVFGSLVGALLADKPAVAARLLLSTVLRCDGTSVHWPSRISELTTFGGLMQMNLMPAKKPGQMGAGRILLETLEKMQSIESLAVSHASFAAAYEVAEYAVGLVAQPYVEEENSRWPAPPSGQILWRWWIMGGGGDKRSIEPLEVDFRNSGLRNELLANGFAAGSPGTFDGIEKQYRDMLLKYGLQYVILAFTSFTNHNSMQNLFGDTSRETLDRSTGSNHLG